MIYDIPHRTSWYDPISERHENDHPKISRNIKITRLYPRFLSHWKFCWHATTLIRTPILNFYMMTSSNGNIFLVTGPLCGEFTGHHKGQWRGALMFFHVNKRLSKQSQGWWFKTPSRSLWRHCNENEIKTLTSISRLRDFVRSDFNNFDTSDVLNTIRVGVQGNLTPNFAMFVSRCPVNHFEIVFLVGAYKAH